MGIADLACSLDMCKTNRPTVLKDGAAVMSAMLETSFIHPSTSEMQNVKHASGASCFS